MQKMFCKPMHTALAAVRHFSAEAATFTKLLTTMKSDGIAKTKAIVKPKTSHSVSSSSSRDTLGKRLLGLICTKRSAVIAIQKWREEGHTVRKYELNRIVRELRKLKRCKHALEVCEWMTKQHDMKLLEGDYAVHLDLIAKIRGLASAEKFFEDLPDKMKGGHTCTALLHSYVQNKESEKAEALMGKMSECGFLKHALPYNHMLSLYITNGQLEKVPGMIQELKRNTPPDVITYNLWLSVCASQNDVDTAEKALLEMKKAKIHPDWITYSSLTNLYIKTGLLEKAATSLKDMEKCTSRRARAAYSSLISLHTNIRDKDGVHRVWKNLKSVFPKMSDAEYICMISSLVKLGEFEEAENLYSEWTTVSPTGDSRVPNIVLAAHINKNGMEMAEKFYNQMVERGITPSYTTWELLTWGYLEENRTEKVLDSFEKAVGSVKKWSPQERLVREVYKNLEENGNIEGAEKLLVILRKAGHVSTEIYNWLLRVYAKAGKMPLIVVERMKKDKVELEEETLKLIQETSKMCVSEVCSNFE